MLGVLKRVRTFGAEFQIKSCKSYELRGWIASR